MKYLITGNLGYIGPILSKYIKSRDKNAFIIGFDTGFFLNCTISSQMSKSKSYVDLQVYSDVRDYETLEKYLNKVDHVIQLAAISNDPMGNEFAEVTNEINQVSSIYLAKRCINLGISSFTFASSCSVYGAGSDSPRTEKDPTNPLTAYAKSKIGTEEALKEIDSLGSTKITCLRFATACGYSPNLRLDLVLNDFVATAITTNAIKILSDGSPWRPLIDVEDMARALYWSCERKSGESLEIINIGSEAWNYQIKDLADSTKSVLGENISIDINSNAAPDKRSYRVSFDKFFSLAPKEFIPQITLKESIKRIFEGIEPYKSELFLNRNHLIRLSVLRDHKNMKHLDQNLFWKD